MKVKVQTLDAKAGGDIELDDEIFGVEPRADILHRVVTWQLINRRGPARAARERSDVARTGKKFGSRRAAAPPVTAIAAPRSSSAAARPTARAPAFSRSSLNKKVRALGLKMALSSKAMGGQLIVLDNLDLQGRQDPELQREARQAGLRQDRAGDRRRRAQRRFRPRFVEPRAASTCCRRSAPTSTTSCATRRWS